MLALFHISLSLIPNILLHTRLFLIKRKKSSAISWWLMCYLFMGTVLRRGGNLKNLRAGNICLFLSRVCGMETQEKAWPSGCFQHGHSLGIRIWERWLRIGLLTRKKILYWLGEKIYNTFSQLVRLMQGETTLNGGQFSSNLRILKTNFKVIKEKS